jgi:predicted DNA-binding transcriptional regulator AlpA
MENSAMNVTTTTDGRIRIHTDDPILLGWLRDPVGRPLTSKEIRAAADRGFNADAAARGLVRRAPLLPNKARVRAESKTQKRPSISPDDIKVIAAAVVAATSVAPQLLDQADAWRYCGLSRSAWFRLRSADQLPGPVNIDRSGLRWRKADLDKWLARLKPKR